MTIFQKNSNWHTHISQKFTLIYTNTIDEDIQFQQILAQYKCIKIKKLTSFYSMKCIN